MVVTNAVYLPRERELGLLIATIAFALIPQQPFPRGERTRFGRCTSARPLGGYEMRMTTFGRAAGLAALATLSPGLVPAAQAATIFSTTMRGSNENPPATSAGIGFGQLTVADDINSFSVLINFSGLGSNAVAGHVHCCSAVGSNAAVAIGFTVPNAMAGTITGTYDLTLASTYTSAFLAASGGTAASARSTFLTGLSNGLGYLNIHTTINPGGEIRGQLAAVPEPTTWALMLVGFGAMGFAMRRRQNLSARIYFT